MKQGESKEGQYHEYELYYVTGDTLQTAVKEESKVWIWNDIHDNIYIIKEHKLNFISDQNSKRNRDMDTESLILEGIKISHQIDANESCYTDIHLVTLLPKNSMSQEEIENFYTQKIEYFTYIGNHFEVGIPYQPS